MIWDEDARKAAWPGHHGSGARPLPAQAWQAAPWQLPWASPPVVQQGGGRRRARRCWRVMSCCQRSSLRSGRKMAAAPITAGAAWRRAVNLSAQLPSENANEAKTAASAVGYTDQTSRLYRPVSVVSNLCSNLSCPCISNLSNLFAWVCNVRGLCPFERS